MSVTNPGSVRADSSTTSTSSTSFPRPTSATPPVPTTLEQMLTAARNRLVRLAPHELLSCAPDAVILDTRTPSDRALYGCIPGSVHTPRTVLEWRVAMDAPLRLPAITSTDQLLVVVCNEGFSSSLAAVCLQDLGFHRATDLVGGVLAWRDAGLDLVPPTNDEIGVRCLP